ncbi:MAG: phosphatase PAP2 family protein [Eubacterium sp.]|nr:phosphatase PAP2 family protein [Eubacterium sp.]
MAQLITAWDVSVLEWIQENLRVGILVPLMKGITHLGDSGIFWIALVVLLLFFKRTRKAGAVAAVSVAVCYVIVNLLIKPLAARPRPYDLFPAVQLIIERQADASFPSGHAANGFACSLVLLRMLPKKAGVPLVILAAVISFSRLFVGVHYPSDVIAGFLIALAVSQLTWYFASSSARCLPFRSCDRS